MTITLTNIRSGYEGFHLADISLEIAQGSLTALIGPNGCGKSTLLKTIAGFLPPGGGTVNIAGQDITKQRRNTVAKSIAVLPQQPIVPPGVTVDQLIGYGRAPYQNLLGIRSVEDHTAIEEALKAVDLTELGDRRLSDLSGGQRQRAFVAMCIAQQTPYVLFDEPTSFLDIKYQYEILDLLKSLNEAGKTIVVVLHDIAQAARYATNLIVMQSGAIHSAGQPGEIVTPEMVSAVYGIQAKVYPDPVTGTAVVTPLTR